MSAPVTFTWAGFRRGLRLVAPALPSFIPFGLVVGLQAAGQGLSALEITLMSLTVFAGTSQLVGLGAWGWPVPVLAVAVAALVVNLRMAPMTAALTPMFHGLHGWRLWASLFTVTDHSFAMSVKEMRDGHRDAAVLLGMGIPTWLWWTSCVTLGHALAGVMTISASHPLVFAGLATMAALTVTLWRGRTDLLPWGVAGAVGVALSQAGLPTPWPILAGAIAGSAAGALRDMRRP